MQADERPHSADLEALAQAWGHSPPDSEKLAFLALSAKGRAQVLQRITTLEALTSRSKRPSRAEQERAADALGLRLKRLQGLMRDWSDNPSILVASPEARARRPTRREIASRDVMDRTIAKVLARYPYVAEPHVSRRLSALCTRLGIKPPARMTVRRALEKARAVIPQPSRFIDAPAEGPQLAAPAPGTELVLAEQFYEAAIAEPDGSSNPASARFLIDTATWFVVGASTGDLAEVAADAEETLLERSYSIGPWQRPGSLSIAADLLPEEDNAIRANAAALGISVRYSVRQPMRRWIRSRLQLEQIPTAPAPTRRSATPAHWRRLTREEFAYLLHTAVEAHREEKQRSIDFSPDYQAPFQPGDKQGLAEALTRLLKIERRRTERS